MISGYGDSKRLGGEHRAHEDSEVNTGAHEDLEVNTGAHEGFSLPVSHKTPLYASFVKKKICLLEVEQHRSYKKLRVFFIRQI